MTTATQQKQDNRNNMDKALKHKILAMVEALQEIDEIREHKKKLATQIEKEFGVKKKVANKVAKALFKNNVTEMKEDNDLFEQLVEKVQ